LCTILSVTVLCAQSPSKFSVAAGVGLAPVYHGKNASTEVPALSLQFAYKLGKSFSLGAFAGYSASTSSQRIFSDGFSSKIENKTKAFGLRGEFSRDLTDKLELYGGLMLGYRSFDLKEVNTTTGLEVERQPDAPTPYNPNQAEGAFLYSGFVGAKYYFKDHFGLFGELGYGLSLFSMGTTFKF
jgi:hypothetical protein